MHRTATEALCNLERTQGFRNPGQVQKSWKYEVIHSSFAPIEEAVLGPLNSALRKLDEAASMGDPLDEATSSSNEKYMTLAKYMVKQVEVFDLFLTEVDEVVANGLDELRRPGLSMIESLH